MKIRVRLSKNLTEINATRAKNICAQLNSEEVMVYVNPNTGCARIVDNNVVGGYKIMHKNQTRRLLATLLSLPEATSSKREREIVRACWALADKEQV